MFYFFFNFNVIIDENVYRSMIYLANSDNLSFSLLFVVQAVFRIYDNNLLAIKIVKSAALRLVS